MLSDVYKITERDIKMSYGLLNVLCKTVGELDSAALLALDNTLREQVLAELLATRDASGTVTAPFNPFEAPYSIEEVTGLLGWAQEHVYDFFVKSAAKSVALSKLHQSTLAALQEPFAGGAASASKTPSV